ncbi:MAG: FecR family protein [Pseudomonadota bacterium]|nr:FecR family protein [Pseudomonadota bacterium]
MNQSTSQGAAIFDRVLMGIAAVCFLGAAYLLYDDSLLFSHELASDGLEEVGRVILTQNDVRRKIRDNFAWFSLKSETIVFNGDSIFTGPASRVSLIFNSGAELSLDENSLVVLKTETRDLSLNLKYGEVSKIAQHQGKVFLDQGDGERTEVSGENAVFKIKAQKGSPVEVKVISGKVGFREKRESPIVTLTKNNGIKISPQGALETTKSYDVELLNPRQGDEVWIKELQAKLIFNWNASDEVKLYQLEISRTKNFSEVSFKKTFEDKKFEFPDFKDRGKYYWRVLALEKIEAKGVETKLKKIGTSDIKYFMVREQKSPELVFPPSGSSLLLGEKQLLTPSGKKINLSDFLIMEKAGIQALKFTWDKKNYENVVFELSSDRGFSKDILEKFEIADNEILLEKIPKEGIYYWRIYGNDPDKGERLASRPALLNVVKSIDLTLVKPANNLVHWLKLGKADIEFQWKANDAIKFFEIEVSLFKDMTNPMVKKIGEDKEFKLQQFSQKGDFYWRINGIDKQSGKEGFEYRKVVSSEVFRFSTDENLAPQPVFPPTGSTVITSMPRVFSSIEKVMEGGGSAPPDSKGLKFLWNNNGFKNVIFELSKTNDFSNLEMSVLLGSSGEQLKFPELSDGKYFWRVKSNEPTGERENLTSRISEVQILKEIPTEPLAAPEPKDITKRIELQPSGTGSFIAIDLNGKNKPYLDWKASKNANAYHVMVSSDKAMTRVVTASKVTETKFDWKEIKPGKFFWQVKAESERMPSSLPSAPGQLIVTVSSPKVEGVRNVEEKVTSNEEMNAPIPPVNLKWNLTPLTAKYLIEVADNEGFQGAKKIKSREEKIKYELLKTGQYFWRVTALDEFDREISSVSPPQSFQYQRKMGLKTPPFMSPAFDSSMVFLSKGASHVVLVWKKVSEAEYYELEMSDSVGFSKPYYANRSASDREYVQRVLPVGKNYWRIRAVNNKYQSDWTQPIPFDVSYGASQ